MNWRGGNHIVPPDFRDDHLPEPDDYYEQYSEWLMQQADLRICNGDDLLGHYEAGTRFDDFLAQREPKDDLVNDIPAEVRSEFVADVANIKRVIVSESEATQEAARLLDKAHEERFEVLKDHLSTYYERVHVGIRIPLECGCTAVLRDRSDPWSRYVAWEFDDCPEHDSTPIAMSWCSTPQLWSAIREGVYDGAPDAGWPSNCNGHGKTVKEARDDLIEQETR